SAFVPIEVPAAVGEAPVAETEAAEAVEAGAVDAGAPEAGVADAGTVAVAEAPLAADAPPPEAAASGAPSGVIEFEDRTALVAADAALGGEGVLGRMADLVAFAEGYEQVGKRLLGRTVVVDEIGRALELQRHGVGDRLVTLEGDVVDGDGVVAGGS